jgi:hypothetical protein
MNSFSNTGLIWNRMDPFPIYRRRSKGFMLDPPAKVHSNIMFGAGFLLNPEFVKDNKITHIVNCAGHDDTPRWVPESFKDRYTCLNAKDSFTVDITDWYPEFERTMNQYLHSKECDVIYVHCQAGMNRSGFLTVLYCCIKFHYTYQSVCRAVLVQRPCALMNHVFHKQVKDYIEKRS